MQQCPSQKSRHEPMTWMHNIKSMGSEENAQLHPLCIATRRNTTTPLLLLTRKASGPGFTTTLQVLGVLQVSNSKNILGRDSAVVKGLRVRESGDPDEEAESAAAMIGRENDDQSPEERRPITRRKLFGSIRENAKKCLFFTQNGEISEKDIVSLSS
uniref:Uncharacterized protein n=1 Tax=Romanomermis culicivorax TaxID=13658 RepID=A0A915HL06_ROMCU